MKLIYTITVFTMAILMANIARADEKVNDYLDATNVHHKYDCAQKTQEQVYRELVKERWKI